MQINDWLIRSQKRLESVGIDSARLDCLILLEDALGKNRAHLLAHLDDEIPELTEVKLNNKIIQRTKNMPLAYIRGHAPFYGRDFKVSSHVLIPRPETESIIDLALQITLPSSPMIADIGTGSGCIGVTLALELPKSRVYFCDIDSNALNIAKQNAKKHGVKAVFKKQSLLESAPAGLDLIVANLPYVPSATKINSAAQHEPSHAIFAGTDGLDLYRIFWRQLSCNKVSYVISESLPMQHEAQQKLAHTAGYKLNKTSGFAQLFTNS